jgi:hypothetical protein
MNIQQTNINAGSNEELICTINSIKNSSMQWQWYHNSILLSSKFDRYMISNATREHMGMYQCCFISSSSDLNSCCAQTQIRIISKFFFNFIFITRIKFLRYSLASDPGTSPEIGAGHNGEKLRFSL